MVGRVGRASLQGGSDEAVRIHHKLGTKLSTRYLGQLRNFIILANISPDKVNICVHYGRVCLFMKLSLG